MQRLLSWEARMLPLCAVGLKLPACTLGLNLRLLVREAAGFICIELEGNSIDICIFINQEVV